MKERTSPRPSPYKGEGESQGLTPTLSLRKRGGNKVPSFLRRGCRGGLEQRRELRKNLTPAERRLWQKLKRKQLGGFKFRRQHQIDQYIVDFYCAELCLIIEIDGDIHVVPQKIKNDKLRQQELENRGFTVSRYTNNDVRRNLDGVLSDILKICENLTPALSLRRRGRTQNPLLFKEGIQGRFRIKKRMPEDLVLRKRI